VGESNPVQLDHEAARSAGYPDLVAHPMFDGVSSGSAIAGPLLDPEVDVDFAHMVHGGQEFRWGPLVFAGDEVTTTASVRDIAERGGMRFYVFRTESINHRGDVVCIGVWTNIVRRPQEDA
jgi:acyl dehydratase